jgi:hypothetical protein
MIQRVVLLMALLALIFVCGISPVAATAPAGAVGWLTINCDVDGASVYLDNVLMGTVSGGSFDIPDGNRYSTYTVKKDGYYDAGGEISFVPGGPANAEITVSLTPKPVGSGKGWITVHCDVDGASVAFNGVTKGTISGGSFTQEVSTTGTPYTTYSVTQSGYYSYTGSVTMPSDDQTVDLYPTLNPIPVTAIPTTVIPATASTVVGGDTGWYLFHCNVNGASVSLDGTNKGAISGGVLSIMVYTTGTPYSTYVVSMDGYDAVSGALPSTPAKGQTKDVYVTLTASSTPVTVAPAGSGLGTYAVYCNVDGASVYFDDTYQGVISNGVLYDSVSVTGTPFSTYRVEKAGYVTASGSIVQQPAAGEIVSLHTSLLKATQTTAPVTRVPTTKPSPLPLPLTLCGVIGAGAFILGIGCRQKNR